jgi:hypothetical protein
MDKTTKIILTAIALGLWLNAAVALFKPTPVVAQGGTIDVRVVGGRLDYETDVSGGPTLKVCTQC